MERVNGIPIDRISHTSTSEEKVDVFDPGVFLFEVAREVVSSEPAVRARSYMIGPTSLSRDVNKGGRG